MKYKTLFRLMMKALGILFIGISIPQLCWGLRAISSYLFDPSGTPFFAYFSYEIPQIASGLLELGFGLYLFFGGKWIVNKAIPSNRPYCHECGYELRNLTNNRCPECGTTIQSSQDNMQEV